MNEQPNRDSQAASGTGANASASLAKSHVRSSSLLVAGRMFGVGVNFLVQVLTVRYLPKDGYGAYAFAMSIVMVAAMVSAFGMDKAASRFLPMFLVQNQRGKFVGALRIMLATTATMGLAVVGGIALCIAFDLPLLPGDPQTRAVLGILILLSVTNAFDALFVALFAAMSRADAIFIRRHILGPLLKLVAAATVCLIGGNVVWFAVAQVVAGVIGFIIYVAMFAEMMKPESPVESTVVPEYPARELFSFSATVCSGDLAFLLRSAFVPIVIGFYFVKAEVAAFHAVMPVARLNEVVMNTFAIMFVPAAARLFATGDDKKLNELYAKNAIWTTILSFPLFVASFSAATPVSELLFGQQYAESGLVLSILSLGYFASAVFGVNIRMLRVAGKLRSLIVMDIVTIIVAIAAISICVPRFGAVGGAAATTVTFFVQLLAVQYAVTRSTPVNTLRVQYLLPFFTAVLIALVVKQGLHAVALPPVVAVMVAALASMLLPILFFRQINLAEFFPELQAIRRKFPQKNVRPTQEPAGQSKVGQEL